MIIRRILLCATALLLCINSASAARYQRCKDGKTLVWNSLRGVAQDANWSGLRDLNGYATGEGTLTWTRLGEFVNSYTGKMVRGKFEGPVIRQQGNTRLEANFANGEKVSGWSEPGSSPAAVQRPPPNEQPENAEELPIESPSPSPARIPSPTPTATERPSPTPTPRATPSPTPTPRSSPSPTPAATATFEPSPSPTPTPRVTTMSTPMGMPALMPTATPTPLRSFSPSLAESPINPDLPPAAAGEGAVNTLELGRSPEPEMKIEAPPRSTVTVVPKTTPATPVRPRGPSGKLDPNVKRQLIAQFKKQIDVVLGEVRDATNNFREVDRLEQVRSLPPAASSHVTLLTGGAEEFRAVVGYDVAFYECLAEMQTVDALLVVDQTTSIIAAKDTPVARKILASFRSRYPKPSAEAQKPLWRYLDSMYALCDRLKNDAESRLQRARSFESEGKKTDALREYREINRIYPNKVTAERIRLLESQPR